MSQITKCDITGKADVPTYKVSQDAESPMAVVLDGERIQYDIRIYNKNGYHAIDVSQEHVLEEMVSLMTKQLNALRNPAKNQTPDG